MSKVGRGRRTEEQRRAAKDARSDAAFAKRMLREARDEAMRQLEEQMKPSPELAEQLGIARENYAAFDEAVAKFATAK